MSRRSGGAPAGADVAGRFARHVAVRGLWSAGDRLLVAVSGGLDSTVLLHLLRFGPGLPTATVRAAHLDHAMRAGSAGDADWVRGLCRAWGIELVEARLESGPASEASAREARHGFLERAASEGGEALVLTAHHADDQAETVLFRALRGTGVRGLRGIPERRGRWLRPLLPFWREELEAYARSARLAARPDPSNLDPRWARNVLRHEILPRAEAAVAPGARRALVRLARLAAAQEAAWASLLSGLLDAVVEEEDGGRIVVARQGFLAYAPAVRARLLRALVRRLGGGLDEAGTRAALEFTSSGASGRCHPLPGGLGLRREFDRLVLSSAEPTGRDHPLLISGVEPGGGELSVGGRSLRVEWARSAPRGDRIEAFSPSRLHFPLRFRGRVPGDRIRLPYGSKKLKKLLAEARVPAGERDRVPVLADGRGRTLWVPGIARAAGIAPDDGETPFFIGIQDADNG